MQRTRLPFELLVDGAPDGVIVYGQDMAIVLVNARAERMFGYARDELIGRPIDILIPEAPRARTMGVGIEAIARHKDGSELPIEISLAPIQTDDGPLVTVAIRDVSERRKLEHELQRASAFLASAVDAVPEAFALFDDHERLVMLNGAGREMFRAKHDSVLGLTFPELLERALRRGAFDLSHETREQLYERWLAYHRDPSGAFGVRTGTGRYLRARMTRTSEHGWMSLVHDVTDDVERAGQLLRLSQAAEEANRAKTEFVSSMSHELRTPLNAILGFAQLLESDRREPLTERQSERLAHILRSGEHLLRLIDDVLDLSRVEAGRIAVSREPVNAREVVAEVIATLEPMAARAQIAIVPRAAAEIPRVHVDRTRLAQILMNFGSNAIKYGKPGGHVSFALAQLNVGTVRITVSDDGIGIPEDKRDKVFEPFERAGQEGGSIEGTGIGLTITKRLAEIMKGRVGFTSEVDRGSTFWVDLPVHRSITSELARQARTATVSPLASAGVRHKIIYIEDNASNVAFMQDLTSDLRSIELVTAPTAEIGLDLVRTQLPEVVIMDINLPGMSGLAAMQRMREWPETKHIPVIGLSAAAFVTDTQRAGEAGFYRYLTKPVRLTELTSVLEELLIQRSP